MRACVFQNYSLRFCFLVFQNYSSDFESFSTPNPDLAKWIAKNLEFDQLILEFYDGKDPNSGWVHCSYNLMGNRKKILTALKTKSGVVYRNGFVSK